MGCDQGIRAIQEPVELLSFIVGIGFEFLVFQDIQGRPGDPAILEGPDEGSGNR